MLLIKGNQNINRFLVVFLCSIIGTACSRASYISPSQSVTKLVGWHLANDLRCSRGVAAMSGDLSIHQDVGHSKPIVDTLKISFGETLEELILPSAATWSVSGSNESIKGKGNTLKNLVFDEPGSYKIDLQENKVEEKGVCNHSHLPETIYVTVSPIKMVFHTNEMDLSADIRKGVETQGIVMKIPVSIETYGKQSLVYTQTIVNTAGVGTSVLAILSSNSELKTGRQILTYRLSGIAQNEAYIMFDFVDINGEVQSALLSSKVK